MIVSSGTWHPVRASKAWNRTCTTSSFDIVMLGCQWNCLFPFLFIGEVSVDLKATGWILKCTRLYYLLKLSHVLQKSLDSASQCRWAVPWRNILQKQPKTCLRQSSGMFCDGNFNHRTWIHLIMHFKAEGKSAPRKRRNKEFLWVPDLRRSLASKDLQPHAKMTVYHYVGLFIDFGPLIMYHMDIPKYLWTWPYTSQFRFIYLFILYYFENWGDANEMLFLGTIQYVVLGGGVT